jgi:Ca2+-binding EF-hand superfamily protein
MRPTSFLATMTLVGTTFIVRPAFAEPNADQQAPKKDPVTEAAELEALLDPNQDGFISDKEARGAYDEIHRQIKSRSEKGKRLLKQLDRNGNRKVELREVQIAIAVRREKDGGVGELVAKTFERLDTDVDGQLTPKEYREMVMGLSLHNPNAAGKLAQLLREMDVDGNQVISRLEALMGAEGLARYVNMKIRGMDPDDEAAMEHAKEVLAELDKDKNELLSRREVAKNKKLKSVFHTVDQDEDKSLTVNEMYEYLKAQQKLAARHERAAQTREGREIRKRTLRALWGF